MYMFVWVYSWITGFLFAKLSASVLYTCTYMYIHAIITELCHLVLSVLTGIQEKLRKFQHFPQDMNLAFLPAFFPHPMATTPIMKPKSATHVHDYTTCGTFHTSMVCMQETFTFIWSTMGEPLW